MLLTNLGNKFKQAREIKGFTQSQVAEKAHINDKYYGRIERNECFNITLVTLTQICNVLNIEELEMEKNFQIIFP